MGFGSETWRQSHCFFGNVVSNVGILYGIEPGYRQAGNVVVTHGERTWDYTPHGFTFIGRHFSQDGFWLASLPAYANYYWHVGIVRDNVGTLYEVSRWGVESLRDATWDAGEGELLGRLFDVNGFWVRRTNRIAERPPAPP